MANYKIIDDTEHVQEKSTRVEKCIYGEECMCMKLFNEIKCKKK